MKKGVVYYLSSLESFCFEPVRECRLVAQMAFESGKQCALVRLSPPVNLQDWGVPEDVESFVLATRHDGETLFPISEFPCFVHIALPHSQEIADHKVVRGPELEVIAWGEIYRTREDAENHIFENTK